MSIRRSTVRAALAVAVAFALPLVGELGPARGTTRLEHSTHTVSVAASGTNRTTATTTTTSASRSVMADSFDYAGTGDPRQRLEATWNPRRVGAPWVVTVHGGSWIGGSPASVRDAAALFRRSGFQVFNIAYRLAGGIVTGAPVRWIDQRHDVLTALTWIRANASAFGIDPDRGALYGSSAGGNLALAAGLAGDGANGIRGIVSVAGVVQPSRLWDDMLGRNRGERATPAMRRLAGRARTTVGCAYPPPRPVAGCAARWRATDPANALSPHDPAVLLYQGLTDPKIPQQMATTFRQRLARANVVGSLVLVPRMGHTQQLALDGGKRQAAMISFLRQRTAVSSAPALSRIAVARRGGASPRLTVRVRSQRAGTSVAGRVVAIVGRRAVAARLVRGKALLALPRLAPGTRRVSVRYLGSPSLQPRARTVTVRVRAAR